MEKAKYYCVLILFSFVITVAYSQNRESDNDIYVDKQGVIRYKRSNAEAAFFGVNYTVPFAFGYRSHKALNVDLEKAIDQDVYHFSRLGLDAFRVHVWDTEISDSMGNLLQNEHLLLFDYLLAKLKMRNIKVLITPIAFWGNGYPEKDINTGSFSSLYGKQKALVNDTAIRAQENYLRQFFKHINPYTKLTYGNDPNVVAMEINNEPHHSGPKIKTTEYVNRMAKAVRSTGWNKPVFYNISESPLYADAVANADVNGHSFQWYPTGLVANRTLQGNFLPNVDLYKIPFGDTIAKYRNRARMVYEFDAADVLQPYMYPAMARSFRTAGFQWATQFAYDPMATAYANTEYQTHYVNLAYTPSKAISLLIASKVFHKVPRLKSYGAYPADSSFDVFRVSYKNLLSEMNAEEEFYYSNTTTTQPKTIAQLKHLAGFGSSPVVNYQGYGAYFLDKVSDGIWRLEVLPDAIQIRDPFEKASPKKEVTTIQWRKQPMHITLPELGNDFKVFGMDSGNHYTTTATANHFTIQPGTYLLTRQSIEGKPHDYPLSIKEFIAPLQTTNETIVVHSPYSEVTGGKAFTISTKIVGVDSLDKITVEMRSSANRWTTLTMQPKTAYDYTAEVPADMVTAGVLNYRIIIQKANNNYVVFPGNHKGNPYAWDAIVHEAYETYVAAGNSYLYIFDATTDRNSINLYNPDWRNNKVEYITAFNSKQLVLKATIGKPLANNIMGWQFNFSDKLKGRIEELSKSDRIVIRARTDHSSPVKLRVAFVTSDAKSFAATCTLSNQYNEIEILLTDFKPDSTLLLPRPYPGFLPLWFKANSTGKLEIAETEKIEFTFGHEFIADQLGKPLSVEVESAWIIKSN